MRQLSEAQVHAVSGGVILQAIVAVAMQVKRAPSSPRALQPDWAGWGRRHVMF
jgi:hypothetical protein